MSVATEAETTLLETVRALPSEEQRAVLNFALFLQQQEDARRIEADEAEWDRLFSQPEKMARFAKWAEQCLAENPSTELLDDSRL